MDKYHGIGGSYTINPRTGEREQTEAPTQDHPQGNRPRASEADPIIEDQQHNNPEGGEQ